MGLMILAIFIGAMAGLSGLLLGASLWVVFILYALVGAAFILIAAIAMYLASLNAPRTAGHRSKAHPRA